MRAIFIRHGQTEANRSRTFLGQLDPPLDERGRAQASAAANALRHFDVAAIMSSDLARAWETAAAVGHAVGVPVQRSRALRELDVGELDGVPVEEGRARFPDFFERWRERPGSARMPGGERLCDVQERAWAVVQREAVARSEEETVLFVTHTFVILSLVCRAIGLPLDQFRRLRVDTGSLSVIEFTGEFAGEKTTLRAFNIVPGELSGMGVLP